MIKIIDNFLEDVNQDIKNYLYMETINQDINNTAKNRSKASIEKLKTKFMSYSEQLKFQKNNLLSLSHS